MVRAPSTSTLTFLLVAYPIFSSFFFFFFLHTINACILSRPIKYSDRSFVPKTRREPSQRNNVVLGKFVPSHALYTLNFNQPFSMYACNKLRVLINRLTTHVRCQILGSLDAKRLKRDSEELAWTSVRSFAFRFFSLLLSTFKIDKNERLRARCTVYEGGSSSFGNLFLRGVDEGTRDTEVPSSSR